MTVAQERSLMEASSRRRWGEDLCCGRCHSGQLSWICDQERDRWTENNKRETPFLAASADQIYPTSESTALAKAAKCMIGRRNGTSTAASSKHSQVKVSKLTPAPREPRFL